MKNLKTNIAKFIVDFITMYIKAENDAGKQYNGKPITAVHSQITGLVPAINKVFKTELTGMEVWNDHVKPLVDAGKLYTAPAKKGYMISVTPFKRTQTTNETTNNVLEMLAKQYAGK